MLPEAFLSRLKLQLGDEYDDYLRSLDRPRAVALRFNPLKTAEFPSLPFVETAVPWADYGYYYTPDARPGVITTPPTPGQASMSGTRRGFTTSRRPAPWPR